MSMEDMLPSIKTMPASEDALDYPNEIRREFVLSDHIAARKRYAQGLVDKYQHRLDVMKMAPSKRRFKNRISDYEDFINDLKPLL